MVSVSPVLYCHHEEADTTCRTVVHVVHALEQGQNNILVCTDNTDVVVIINASCCDISVIQHLIHIWVAFGMTHNWSYYNINAICAKLREQRTPAQSVFRAFTSCGNTSMFNGNGKKSAQNDWQLIL